MRVANDSVELTQEMHLQYPLFDFRLQTIKAICTIKKKEEGYIQTYTPMNSCNIGEIFIKVCRHTYVKFLVSTVGYNYVRLSHQEKLIEGYTRSTCTLLATYFEPILTHAYSIVLSCCNLMDCSLASSFIYNYF